MCVQNLSPCGKNNPEQLTLMGPAKNRYGETLPACASASQWKRKHQTAHTHERNNHSLNAARVIHRQTPLYHRDYWHEDRPTSSPSADRSSQHDSFISLEWRFREQETSQTGNDSVYSKISTDTLHREGMQTIQSEHVTTVSTALLLRAAVCVCVQPCKLSVTSRGRGSCRHIPWCQRII